MFRFYQIAHSLFVDGFKLVANIGIFCNIDKKIAFFVCNLISDGNFLNLLGR